MSAQAKAAAVTAGVVAFLVGFVLSALAFPVAFPWVLLAGLMLVVLTAVYRMALEWFE